MSLPPKVILLVSILAQMHEYHTCSMHLKIDIVFINLKEKHPFKIIEKLSYLTYIMQLAIVTQYTRCVLYQEETILVS